MKPVLLISFFVLYLNFLNAQTVQKIETTDTLYFKFNYQKNQEIKYQKTIDNTIVGEYYYNYLSKDKQQFIIFTFNYNKQSITTEKKSIIRKRKIKYIDYLFLKSKSIMELNKFFEGKIIMLIDSKEIKGCEVKLKQVIYQTSVFLEM